jgi:uncharacterized membrane protein
MRSLRTRRSRLEWESVGRRYAPTATTDITLTLARLTATTDLTGSRVVCSSVPGRGTAGDGRGAGVVGGVVAMAMAVVALAMAVVALVTAVVAMVMVVGSLADAASQVDADLHVVQRAASTGRLAEAFMAALWRTAVEDSTLAAASTVVVVDTAAVDIGNRGGAGVS